MNRKTAWVVLGMALLTTSLFGRIDLARIQHHRLEIYPYQWAMINQLFSVQEAFDLSTSYPLDHYKTVDGYDGEKGYRYEVRCLIPMGEKRILFENFLSPSWIQLAQDLLSEEYREALSKLIGIDLSTAPMEVNLFHYGKGAWMGPHLDLKEKIVTHILYFNGDWDLKDGGGLAILKSKNMDDAFYVIPPTIGTSSVLVRSNCSWHAVLPISETSQMSRRSMTVTFYHPGSVSTMWPPKEKPVYHDYKPSS